MTLFWLGTDSGTDFPPADCALEEPNGLLAAGGDLSTSRLLAAYQRGIFPWYSDGQPILWWSPNPRMVLRPNAFHASRSLRRSLRRHAWTFTNNQDFDGVIEGCAAPRIQQDGTWITTDMRAAYRRLHDEGWCHSVEVWCEGELAGGIYGVAIDRVFFGESMFHQRTDASKLALWYLSCQLAADGFAILDCQMHTPHLASLGATLIDRPRFSGILAEHCQALKRWQSTPISLGGPI